jgi:nicotinate dehydrogenase subunit B
MIEASRRRVLQGAGSLIVTLSYGTGLAAGAAPASRPGRPLPVEALDSWLEIARDGSVTAYCGHIDMGTGIQTAVAQIVADELEVPLDTVRVVMGDTGLTPDQGKSTSSRGVTLGAQPLRVAACEARHALIELGSKRLNVPSADLEARAGFVQMKASAGNRVAYGDLIGDRAFSIDLEVAEATLYGPRIRTKSPLKSPTDYRVVGKSIPRFDVPPKVTGVFEFVHNVRVPGMLHGRVVRLPSLGAKLLDVDESSVAGIPDVQIVRRNDFLGVVAMREEHAVKARTAAQRHLVGTGHVAAAKRTVRRVAHEACVKGPIFLRPGRHGQSHGQGSQALHFGLSISAANPRHARAVLCSCRRPGIGSNDLVRDAVAARHTTRHGQNARPVP